MSERDEARRHFLRVHLAIGIPLCVVVAAAGAYLLSIGNDDGWIGLGVAGGAATTFAALVVHGRLTGRL